MRVGAAIVLTAGLLLSGAWSTFGAVSSSVRLSRSTIASGQVEVLTVIARDLAGEPLVGASPMATVRYRAVVRHYHLPPTDETGQSSVSFHVPPGTIGAVAAVDVTLSNGYLTQNLNASFRVTGQTQPGSVPASGTSEPSALTVVARVLPASVTASTPAWVVVYVHMPSGSPIRGAQVAVTALFKEGTARSNGVTDSSGVATIRINTPKTGHSESVRVTVSAIWRSVRGTAGAQLSLRAAPVPTAAPVPAPTPRPSSTPVPGPPPAAAPVPIPTPTPVPTPTPTPAPLFSSAPPPPQAPPAAGPTPIQLVLATPTPSPTPTLIPTLVPTWTPTPTATTIPFVQPTDQPGQQPTAATSCTTSDSSCVNAMLNIINITRAQWNLPAYDLDTEQSSGTSQCIGSYGHSVHMAQEGAISHDQFPQDICGRPSTEGENVGMFSGPSVIQSLQNIHQLMMGENPNTPAGCSAGVINHACNILSTHFTSVGIGIYVTGNTVWLTEDFMG